MQQIHNTSNNSVPVYLDYDLIALSNTMSYSFEEGLSLASSMLNAPFFITNLYDYVIIHTEIGKIEDPAWIRIVSTRLCPDETIENNPSFYSVPIPRIGKMIYYSADAPSIRQQQLAPYIAWMISQFGETKFLISDSNTSPESISLLHLVNNRLDMIDPSSDMIDRSRKLQLLACFCNSMTDPYVKEISKICSNTAYIAVYKQKYRLFLFPALTEEQLHVLSDLLCKYHCYAGLSFSFSNYKDCYKYASQAIASLNEAAKHNWETHLSQYENVMILDTLYHYSSDLPLSSYRHPMFLALEKYDRDNNSELYLTAITYLATCGDTYKTSKELSMHRNTVLYRLGQIAEITGYNIQDPSCRPFLQYAMVIDYSLNSHNKYDSIL